MKIVFFLVLCGCINKSFSQPALKPYIIKGRCDFIGLKVNKAKLNVTLEVVVIKNNSSESNTYQLNMATNGSLSFHGIASRSENDKSICIKASVPGFPNIILHRPPLQPELFYRSSGRYIGRDTKVDGELLLTFYEKATYDQMLKTWAQQAYNNNKNQDAIFLFDLIDQENIDKTAEQKFHTLMGLQASYSKTKNFNDQYDILSDIYQNIDVDSLPRSLQENFWAGNYGSINDLFGLDSVNTTLDKKNFNRNFGEIVLSDSAKLQVWKTFLNTFIASEFAKKHNLALTLAFDKPDDILGQKKKVAQSLGVKEYY